MGCSSDAKNISNVDFICEFHTVGLATKKDLYAIFVLTVRLKIRSEFDDRKCIGFLAGMYDIRSDDCAR